jgi:hypothetical protein
MAEAIMTNEIISEMRLALEVSNVCRHVEKLCLSMAWSLQSVLFRLHN